MSIQTNTAGPSTPVSACPTQLGSDSSTVSSCDCWSATFRIINLCQQAARSSSSVQKGGEQLLADTLNVARHLVEHWSTLNGCANSESHMTVQTLSSMADAIDLILCDHEKVVEAQAHTQCQAHSWTYIGRLELDTAEAAIVAQEALKHSLIRLAAILQDIEEEAALLSPSDLESLLREKDIKGLITRLFRLLGSVNRLGTT